MPKKKPENPTPPDAQEAEAPSVDAVAVCRACQAASPVRLVVVEQRESDHCAVCGREGRGMWDHCQSSTVAPTEHQAKTPLYTYQRDGVWVEKASSDTARAGGWSQVPVAPEPEPDPDSDPDPDVPE